ncbi:MAG TPA: hypothetical protein VMW58_04580 [Anaerolineae bacterium]|nr:hypothetical protein [Anaerolineae bacterium]
MSQMTDLLVELARARDMAQGAVADLKAASDALEQSAEYQAATKARDALNFAKSHADLVTQAVRETAEGLAARGQWEELDGIQLVQGTDLAWNEQTVRIWCLDWAKCFLVVDTKAFLKAAASGLLPGAPVEITKKPQARIASDLSAYLK